MPIRLRASRLKAVCLIARWSSAKADSKHETFVLSGAETRAMRKPKRQGIVISARFRFDEAAQKMTGYGFLSPKVGSEDIYFGSNAIRKYAAAVKPGDNVDYVLADNTKTRAKCLWLENH
jgi:cold shock CspA family protein